MSSKIYLGKIKHNNLLLLLFTSRSPFPTSLFFFSFERDVHRTTPPTSLRNCICQKHSRYGDQNCIHSPHIQSFCYRGYPQGLASNSEEGIMTEIEFIHLRQR